MGRIYIEITTHAADNVDVLKERALWTPNQEDMLADDWEEVKENHAKSAIVIKKGHECYALLLKSHYSSEIASAIQGEVQYLVDKGKAAIN